MQHPIDNIIFHNNVTSPNTGLEYMINGGGNIINIEFETTGTFSATFEAKVNINSTIWKPISAGNLDTLNLSKIANDKNAIYQVDVTAISLFRVRLSEVNGATTVYGKYVS